MAEMQRKMAELKRHVFSQDDLLTLSRTQAANSFMIEAVYEQEAYLARLQAMLHTHSVRPSGSMVAMLSSNSWSCFC